MYQCKNLWSLSVRLSKVVFLLCVLTLGAFPLSHIAHAASFGVGQTVKETKTFLLPKTYCDMLIKKYPQLALRKENCSITITSSSTKLSGFVQNVIPDSGCPSGSILHSITIGGTFAFWGSEMRETFSWHGDCSSPTVTGQNCGIGLWSIFPVASVNISYCNSWIDSQGNTIAEADYLLNFSAGAGSSTHVLQSSANGRATVISDAAD